MELKIGEAYKFTSYEGVVIEAIPTGVGNMNGEEIIYTPKGNLKVGKLSYISDESGVWEMVGITLDRANELSLIDIDNLIFGAINKSPVSITAFARSFEDGTVDQDEYNNVCERVAELEKEIVNLKKKPAKAKPEVKMDAANTNIA